MVPHSGLGGVRRLLFTSAVLTALAILPLVSACDKVPLLAPSGSVITLFPANTTVPLNGEVEIIATVIENGTTTTTGTGTTATTSTKGAGTPVQNGTLVSFTTTMGSIQPREARTSNGEVRVKFIAAGASGTAKITAYSGGAVATLENLLVGSAAADHLVVTVNPQTVPASGGTATVQARVENAAGAGIAGVPVSFSTTRGTISSTTATTDENGVATTTITTTGEATVTATAGTKSSTVVIRVGERSNLTISGPATATVGAPAAFTITASSTSPISNAVISWGDGSSEQVGTVSGSVSRSHSYGAANNYSVTVSGKTPTGDTETAFTSVSVGGLQATMTSSKNPSSLNELVTFTATVPSGTQVREYRWDFGDGTTTTTSGPISQHSFNRVSSYTVRAQIIGVNGEVLGTPSLTQIVN